MTNLTKISNKLNLMYYEYDKKENKFVIDKLYDKDTTYQDLIKLTYELSKNRIEFLVDEHNDIVIVNDDNFISHLKQRCKNFMYMIKSKNKSVYILSDKHIQYAKNLPFITTHPNKVDFNIKQYDALIFTSKKGVSYLNDLTPHWKDIPSYAMSTQTAKKIKDLEGQLKFIGKGKTGNEFSYELLPLLKDKKVAYIGAQNVVSDLINILNSNHVKCTHIPIYKTQCLDYKEKIDLPKNSIIIFSSPSTINCFLKNVNWQESFTAISIGKTTAQYFPQHIKPVLSENITLQSCVQKALSM